MKTKAGQAEMEVHYYNVLTLYSKWYISLEGRLWLNKNYIIAPKSQVLNFGTTNILGKNYLLWGAALCNVG